MAKYVLIMVLVIVTMKIGTNINGSVEAAVYKVGDKAGWTTIGNVDYKAWSATKNFQVGDTIMFTYNAQFHNVMRVTHAQFRACNASSPIATYTTGNDSIIITTKGHHFFFCGVPGHCQAGQKVDINVLRNNETSLAPSSSPAPSSAPSAESPGPSTNNANTLMALNFGQALFALAFFMLNVV